MSRARTLVLANLALAVVYLVVGRVMLLAAPPPGYATPVFPSSGLALGAVLVAGYGLLPGVALGSTLLQLSLGQLTVPPSLAMGLGAALQAAVGAVAVRRLVREPTSLDNGWDVGLLLLLGGPLACVVSPTIGLGVLSVVGVEPPEMLWFDWWTWWAGDTIGVFVGLPLVVALFERPRPIWRARFAGVVGPSVLAAGVMLLAIGKARTWEIERLDAEFDALARSLAAELSSAFDDSLSTLTTIQAFFESSHRVDPAEFRGFLERSRVGHPSLRAVWYALPEGDTFAPGDLRLDPTGLAAPTTPEATAAVHEAARARRITAVPAAGRELELVAPVLDDVGRPEGVVVALLDASALVGGALEHAVPTDVALALVDETGPGGRALARVGADGPFDPGLSRRFDLEVAGRQLLISVDATHGYLPARRNYDTWLVMVGGVGLSGLLVGYLLVASGHSYRTEGLVARRTAELELLGRAQARFISESEPEVIFGGLLDDLLASVGAAAGVIELRDPDGASVILAERGEVRRGGLVELPLQVGARRAGTLRLGLPGGVSGLPAPTELDALLATAANLVEAWRSARAHEDAVEQLRASEARLRAVVESAVEAIVVFSRDGTVLSMNPAGERLFGWSSEALVGGDVRVLLAGRALGELELLLDEPGEGVVRELEVRHADGSTLVVELALSSARVAGRALYTALFHDITRRRQVQRLHGELISIVSHELRTPVTAIRGAIGLVGAGAAGDVPAKARELLEVADRNCAQLVHLIDDLLDMDRLSSGRLGFEEGPVDLGALVAAAVEANRAYAAQYGVTYALCPLPADVEVRADPRRLTQVLANLLSNAAKFSPEGGVVEVAVRSDGDHVRVSVRDHGQGVPEDFRERIFDRFAQADASNTRRRGGTGLGLAIAKAIVEHHGGRIGFDSAPGEGATFWFSLPVVTRAG